MGYREKKILDLWGEETIRDSIDIAKTPEKENSPIPNITSTTLRIIVTVSFVT